MSCIAFLRRIGILPRYSPDQVTEAEAENLMVDHAAAVERVSVQAERISESSEKLRASIRKLNLSAFGELEHQMQRQGVRRVVR